MIIEYGNTCKEIKSTSKNTKKKYAYKLFAKVTRSPIPNPIKYVDFDINVGIQGSKPLRVSQAPFVFERDGTYEFGCEIKIYWNDKLKLQPYTATHYIKLEDNLTSSKRFF